MNELAMAASPGTRVSGERLRLGGSGARVRSALGLIALALVLLLSGGTDVAQADLHYFNTGEFASEAFVAPSEIAVDETSGNVFVADTGNGRIRVYDDGGAGASLVLDFGEAELTRPFGLAVDQSNGDVYVTDAPEGSAGRIVRFQPDDRENPTAFTEAAFASPPEGSDSAAGEIGSFASKIAIDPTTGDLLVADSGNKQVSRFTKSGTFVSAFDGAGSAIGPFTSLWDVAVGPTGTVFVVADGTIEAANGNPQESRLASFDSAGSQINAYTGIRPESITAITVDQQSGNLVVANGGAVNGTNPQEILRLLIFQGAQQIEEVKFAEFNERMVGLAVDSGRIYGLNSSESHLFGEIGPPTVKLIELRFVPEATVAPPTGATTESVHLVGTVDTGGEPEVNYHFEYSADGGQTWEQTATEPAGSGGSPETVGADIGGLLPGGKYQVRLVASSPFGSSTSPVLNFRTLTVPPLAATGAATAVEAGGAVLNGTVDPRGDQTSYYFEYGPTSAYGARVPASHGTPVGEGRAPVPASEKVEGLQPATTYHFRIVAVNSNGEISIGEDATFTTPASGGGNGRVYELVSPAEKGGNNVKAGLGFGASESGDILTYTGFTALGELSTEGAGEFPAYIGRRTANGWISQPTDPPQMGPSIVVATRAVSDDGTKAVVLSKRKLTPDAVEGLGNVYLRDLVTGQFTLMASSTDISWFNDQVYSHTATPRVFAQGTPSFDHILLQSPANAGTGIFDAGTPFVPGVPAGALFDFTEGELRVVSETPDGKAITGSGVGFKEPGMNVISRDGRRILFTSPSPAGAYLNEDGVVRAISESRRSADPPGTVRAAEQAMGDSELKVVYFISRELTDDSPDGFKSLYRYDVDSEDLEFLAPISDEAPAVVKQVSGDGSSVWFLTRLHLTPDTPEEANTNIYVWRAGSLSLVASMDIGGTDTWWASNNGRYFAFVSPSDILGYDPTSGKCVGAEDVGACRQVYRYDAVTDDLRCLSCPFGRVPTGNASIGPQGLEDIGTQFPRAVTNAGDVFFDTTDQLLPADVNSLRDVYEYSDRNGLVLISSGHGGESRLAAVDVDGTDVFFTTTDQLVRIDKDRNIDVYDARVGGGIPGQNADDEASCLGESCKGAALPAPPPPPVGSESRSARGNAKARRGKRCAGKRAGKAGRKARCHRKKRQHKPKHRQNRTNQDRRQGR